jgi:methionyl-tRNA formyltransferase
VGGGVRAARAAEPAQHVRAGALRLVFAGTPDVAIPALDAIASSDHELLAVLTRPDTVAGRGRAGRARDAARSPVARWADERQVRVLQPRRAGDPEFLEALAELAPDVCPIVAYGGLIPPVALAVPAHGWVNLHFSLLPAWRGAAPVQRAIMAGDEVTGATTFLLEAGLDTGPVYGFLTEPIKASDTAGDLLGRLAPAGAGLLLATLDGIETGTLAPAPQPPDGVSLAPKITTDDARVTWNLPAHVVGRRIRGCTPAPGAWTAWRGERVKLGPVRVLEPDGDHDVPASLTPGELRTEKADGARGARPQPAESFA